MQKFFFKSASSKYFMRSENGLYRPNNKLNEATCDGDRYCKLRKFQRWRQLPPEIVSRILSLLREEDRQSTLVACLVVNSTFYHAAKEILYSSPRLTSTYRVAQFVTCLRRHEDNALLVKKLDLSELYSEHTFGWREWQQRNSTVRKQQDSHGKRNFSVESLKVTSITKKHGFSSNVSDIGISSRCGDESAAQKTRQGKLVFLWNKIKRNGKQKNTARGFTLPRIWQASRSKSEIVTRNPLCAPSSDLPLGHVLHLLRLCKNVIHLDLSRLVLSEDFELPHNHQREQRAMIPGAPVEPRAIYLTDSTAPDDINRLQLHKLEPKILFEMFLQMSTLRHLYMNNVTWIKQSMVSKYVLEAFITNNPVKLLSFKKSGLHSHFAWACQGSLQDMVSVVIMDHIAFIDNLDLQHLFPTRSQLHPDVLEISCVFPIPLRSEMSFNVRITILKASDNRLTHRLKKLCPQYFSLVIELNNSTPPHSQSTAIERRLARRTKSLLRKLKELRDADVQMVLGQSYLTPDIRF